MNNDDLKVLGRNHSVEEALESVQEAHGLFPGKTSIDIIFGRPYQTLSDWKNELNQVILFSWNVPRWMFKYRTHSICLLTGFEAGRWPHCLVPINSWKRNTFIQVREEQFIGRFSCWWEYNFDFLFFFDLLAYFPIMNIYFIVEINITLQEA